jgi:4-amino-4-deoxy-L-arabinose transferase-like glycosyltransferase
MSEFARTRDSTGFATRSFVALRLLTLVSVFILLVARDFSVPLWGSSEAREAHVAELVAAGDWILPLRNGFVPSKPPLLHWSAALLVDALGISGLSAARIVSSLAAVLTVWLVAGFCAAAGSVSGAQRRWWIAAGVLLTSYGFFSMASDARVDMVLCCLVTGAGLTLVRGFSALPRALPAEAPELIRRVQYKAAIWCGVAVLAKGPLGVVFPGLIGVVAAYVFGRAAWVALIPRLGPTALFCCIAAPWYLAAAYQSGDGFIERQVLFENVQRFFGGEGVNSKPWHFYLPVFLSTAFPWSLVAIAALWRKDLSASFTIASGVWVAGVVLLSISDGKRAAYLLTLLPWVAIAVTGMLDRFFTENQRAERLTRLAGHLFSTFAVVVVIAAAGVATFRDLIPSELSTVLNIGIGTGLCWLIWCAFLSRIGERERELMNDPGRSFGESLVLVAGVLIIGASAGLAVKGALKGFGPRVAQVNHIVGASTPVVAIRNRADERLDPIFYLMRRRIAVMPPEIQGQDLPTSGFLIADTEWLKERGFTASRFLVLFPKREPELALVKLGGEGAK